MEVKFCYNNFVEIFNVGEYLCFDSLEEFEKIIFRLCQVISCEPHRLDLVVQKVKDRIAKGTKLEKLENSEIDNLTMQERIQRLEKFMVEQTKNTPKLKYHKSFYDICNERIKCIMQMKNVAERIFARDLFFKELKHTPIDEDTENEIKKELNILMSLEAAREKVETGNYNAE